MSEHLWDQQRDQALEAWRRETRAAERWRSVSDRLETLCAALACVWDQSSDAVLPDEVAQAEAILEALERALSPWKAEILQRYALERARHARYGRSAETLLGVEFPAIPPAEEA